MTNSNWKPVAWIRGDKAMTQDTLSDHDIADPSDLLSHGWTPVYSAPVQPAAVAVPDDVDLWAFCRDVLKRGAAIESQFAQQGYETFIAEIEHAARKEDKRLRAMLSAAARKGGEV